MLYPFLLCFTSDVWVAAVPTFKPYLGNPAHQLPHPKQGAETAEVVRNKVRTLTLKSRFLATAATVYIHHLISAGGKIMMWDQQECCWFRATCSWESHYFKWNQETTKNGNGSNLPRPEIGKVLSSVGLPGSHFFGHTAIQLSLTIAKYMGVRNISEDLSNKNHILPTGTKPASRLHWRPAKTCYWMLLG